MNAESNADTKASITDVAALREALARANSRVHQQSLALEAEAARVRHLEASLRELEALKSALLDQSRDCVKILDLEGRLEFLNQGGMISLELDDFAPLQGKSYLDLWEGETKREATTAFQSALAGIRAEFVGAYPTAKTQRLKWWHVAMNPLRDTEGRISQILAVSRDVSEQVAAQLEAQHAARERETRLRQLADAMPQIVWAISCDGQPLFVNAKWIEYTGISEPESLRIESWHRCTHPEDLVTLERKWMHSQATGETFTAEVRLRNVNRSEYRWHLARGVPIRDASGRATHFIGTSTDIHDHKETESELRKALQARDDFLSIASHELKTPLTALRLQIQLRQRDVKRGELRRFAAEKLPRLIADDERQILRLNRLVDDMLDVSRIRTGKLSLETDVFDLTELARETMERLSGQLENQGCRLRLDAKPGATGRWDRLRIEQVLTNLLTNAGKYAAGQPVEVQVEVSADSVQLSVRDHGAGIAPEDQGRIFDQFERAVSQNFASGLGLGLYISKKIVEAHQGAIRVESEPGQGACFRITLPRNA